MFARSNALRLVPMLYEIPTDNPGVEIKYRFNGGLFNLSRLRSQRLTNITRITELQYADDNATPAHSPEEIQQSVNNFKQAYECFGLTINAKKTKVLAQPTPGAPIPDFNIFMGDTPLEQVDHFSYLGSVLSSQCNSEKDVDTRICAAHVAFGRLYHRVFGNKNLKQQTKLMVYHAVVISTLLYGCESWTLYSRETKKLERFHQQKLRSIMKIKWEDYITNIAVLEKAHSNSIEATILKHQLRWTGHVYRMKDTRLPRQILYSELSTGNRRHGGPLRRYKDQLKRTMKNSNINPGTWEVQAADRKTWRQAIKTAAETFEQDRRRNIDEKRERRKARQSQPRPPPSISCDQCPRMFQARIGLISHQKYKHNN